MLSHLATPSSYSERLEIFHICGGEESPWDQTDPAHCITSGRSLEFSLPQFLSLAKSNNRCSIGRSRNAVLNALSVQDRAWLTGKYSINVFFLLLLYYY